MRTVTNLRCLQNPSKPTASYSEKPYSRRFCLQDPQSVRGPYRIKHFPAVSFMCPQALFGRVCNVKLLEFVPDYIGSEAVASRFFSKHSYTPMNHGRCGLVNPKSFSGAARTFHLLLCKGLLKLQSFLKVSKQ